MSLQERSPCRLNFGQTKNELYKRATKTNQEKYDLLTLSMTDTEKLDDTYNLQMTVEKTLKNHIRFDMGNVFQIFKMNSDTQDIIGFVDLYNDYTSITIKEVALSNQWYSTMPTAPDVGYYRENLKLTYDYLENNIEPRLLAKCHETYLQYSPSQHGGPVLFKTMIDHLQSNTDIPQHSIYWIH
jgi:hypothetical protein